MKFSSPVFSQASGSIGGTTYAHNKGGMYTRARSTPVNKNTVQQQAMRNALRDCSVGWTNTLTGAERNAWDAFAAACLVPDTLGVPRNIGGIAWFVKCNTLRLQAGLAMVTAGPTTHSTAVYTSPTATMVASSGNLSLAFTNSDGWATAVGGAMLVYASPPQNASVNSYKGPYRYAGKIAGAVSPPTSPATLASPYVVTAAKKVFYRVCVVLADGRASNSFRNGLVAS